MNLPPEVEEGGVEYKLQLTPLFLLPRKRAESLATQMRWRVRESPSGYATYFIGVNDDGFAQGLLSEKLECSLTTLSAVAELAGAEIVSIIRRPAQIPCNYFAEVLVVLGDISLIPDNTSIEFESKDSYCELGYFSSVVDLFSDLHNTSLEEIGPYAAVDGGFESDPEALMISPIQPGLNSHTSARVEVSTYSCLRYSRETSDDGTNLRGECQCDRGLLEADESPHHDANGPVSYNSMGVPKCACQPMLDLAQSHSNPSLPNRLSCTIFSGADCIDKSVIPQLSDTTTPSVPSPCHKNQQSIDPSHPPMKDSSLTHGSSAPVGDCGSPNNPLSNDSPIIILLQTSPKLEPAMPCGLLDADGEVVEADEPQKVDWDLTKGTSEWSIAIDFDDDHSIPQPTSGGSVAMENQPRRRLSIDSPGALGREYREYLKELRGVWDTVGSHWSVKGRNMSDIWQETCKLQWKLLEDSKNRELSIEELQILRQIKAFEKQRKYERKLLAKKIAESSTHHQANIGAHPFEETMGEIPRLLNTKLSRRSRRKANAATKQAIQPS